MTSATFLEESFDRRYPLAWWRFFDPYAAYAGALELGYRMAAALRLSEVAAALRHILVHQRQRFEQAVLAQAAREVDAAVCLAWRGKIPAAAAELGFRDEITPGSFEYQVRDRFWQALEADPAVQERFATLQRMRPSRRAFYYRVWELWRWLDRLLPELICEQRARVDSELDFREGV